ncbi:hypothetical protein KEM56_000653 [Ascosphaera pollenicola]|nr:hypothetical protein KEM56_000653 [Ascosphaera pollenicola]
MMEENEIQKPFVIITDKDEAIRNAIRSLFDSDQTATQLCLWHVMKNVAFNIKKKWEGALDGTMLGQTLGSVGSRTASERDAEAESTLDEREAERVADSMLDERDRIS